MHHKNMTEQLYTLQIWLLETTGGMLILSLACGLIAIAGLTLVRESLKALIRPNIEYTFYENILRRWLGSYFQQHRIIGTFIRMNRMGDTIVNCLIITVATFVVVALLSSAITATLIYIYRQAFIFSPLLLFLMSVNIMLGWALINNLLYFRKVLYRLP